MTPTPDLRPDWGELLARRTGVAPSLLGYSRVIDAWAETITPTAALGWSEAECRRTWAEGTPIVVAAPPDLEAAAIEDLLGMAMEIVAESQPAGEGLDRLAAAWDRGEVTPHSFLPTPGQEGTLEAAPELGEALVTFLAIVTLRPALETYLAGCRAHLRDSDWDRGVCPFCGAPPGFADVVEDGRRRLACHVCGGAWTFTRLRCPFCGDADTRNLARLDFEAAADQGYFISTCGTCRGYLKELDRRVRWNGGPALIEDWGSPHFDLACIRTGYRRPARPVILAG